MADAVRTGARAPATDRFTMARLLRAREAGVFIALLVLCLFLSFATDGFLTSLNLLNVGRQISLLGIMAVGMTFVLIAGEVDLSVGSTYAFSGLATGMLIIAGWALLPAIGVGLMTGVAIGLINGVLSTYGRLPSLIATLGMLSIVRGAALILTNGQPVTVNARNGALPDVLQTFSFIGQGYLFTIIPMQLVFFVIVAVLAWIVLSFSNFGFRVYAVGGSAKAARVSGISVNKVKISAFILMGVLAAVAGILGLAFLPSSQAGRTGLGLELDVIAATIVGGASLSGGEGTILGTILGVLIIGVMRNGLVLLGVSPFVQELMIGLVIIIAVGIDKWSTRRTG
ncbi:MULTISPECIES: ABC transporter permease [Mesorhizobium]|uniref:ABC transporter permease n=3 Tax=Mesorhizobium TaxID=68287 RepID=A0AB38TJ46_9HYPH|nr:MULTISPECIES: ABC transporter permease [Mesorhizobium]RUY52338.1 ABC transporter permease [Mesorhizobium sp. M7A.F.Ca.CA.001.13.2.1]MDF3212341.1 ABC transporter permease [Mesorhizobium ciceri]RUY65792.1 ABC transporter permease [Mesorhizobium sp. M7A.F.Ca.CA.001.13.1.1]RUY66817.1 ABC transporter permease [Mesorhizobium sp. M7A.F.Ca.CA.001.05.1.1]RUZ04291.1 ABC transporter permease [Mesorhizobium sp. M7A.F.Ca.CA.001.04.2.1]